VVFLKAKAVLDENRIVQDAYRRRREELRSRDLPIWCDQQDKEALRVDRSSLVAGVLELLDDAFDSHFNDGGFSQKDRSKVDPRFGSADHLRRISEKYALVLDYVVNHLDFQNPLLEAFRRGEGDGAAFLVIDPAELERLERDGTLEKTFRPRPFPLFTGMRKYPRKRLDPVEEMNRRFQEKDLKPLDDRLIAFLSIEFKVRNDQGLTSADRRIFRGFQNFLEELGIREERILMDSEIQPQQKVFAAEASQGMAGLLSGMSLDSAYASVFQESDDELFGEKFFIYTTFSESQVDVNPKNAAGLMTCFASWAAGSQPWCGWTPSSTFGRRSEKRISTWWRETSSSKPCGCSCGSPLPDSCPWMRSTARIPWSMRWAEKGACTTCSARSMRCPPPSTPAP
jgi:hypothetical protein